MAEILLYGAISLGIGGVVIAMVKCWRRARSDDDNPNWMRDDYPWDVKD